MAWESLDWWNLWDYQKVVVAAPNDDVDRLLDLLGYVKGRQFDEWVGDVRTAIETERPATTVTYSRMPFVDNGGHNNWHDLSFDVLVDAINALSPGTWVMIANEAYTRVVDQYMRNETTYSPTKGRRFDAAVWYCYGDGTAFDEDYDGEDFERKGTRRRTKKYVPKELDEQALAELAQALGAKQCKELFETPRATPLATSARHMAINQCLPKEDWTLHRHLQEKTFYNLEGDPIPFLFNHMFMTYDLMACFVDEKEIVVPEKVVDDGEVKTVEGLGLECFKGNKSLESVVLPRSVKYIAHDAFTGIRSKLKSIRYEDSAEGETVFVIEGDELVCTISPEKEITVPDDVKRLGACAFGGCWRLRTLVLHDGMEPPTAPALASCTGLTYVVLTDGSKINVSTRAASECFTESGGVVHYDYEKSERLGIKQPNRKNAVGRTGSRLLAESTSKISETRDAASTEDCANPAHQGQKPLPRTSWDRVEPLVAVRIAGYVEKTSFMGCTTLESVLIGRDCTHIGPGAFEGCAGLKSVTSQRRKSRRVLCSRAFEGCISLETIEIDGIKLWGQKLFENCISLRSLSVTIYDHTDLKASALGKLPRLERLAFMGNGTIKKSAFKGCPALKELVISPETKCEDGAFDGLAEGCVVKCSAESEVTEHARRSGIKVSVG